MFTEYLLCAPTHTGHDEATNHQGHAMPTPTSSQAKGGEARTQIRADDKQQPDIVQGPLYIQKEERLLSKVGNQPPQHLRYSLTYRTVTVVGVCREAPQVCKGFKVGK